MTSRAAFVAWAKFFAILIIPSSLLFLAGCYASNAEADRIRAGMQTLLFEDAAKMRREIELSRLRGNEVLQALPEESTFEEATTALVNASSTAHAAFLTRGTTLTLPASVDAKAAGYLPATRLLVERSVAQDPSAQSVFFRSELPSRRGVQTMWSPAIIATFRTFRAGFCAGFFLDRNTLERGAKQVLSPRLGLEEVAPPADAVGMLPTTRGSVRTIITEIDASVPRTEASTLLLLGPKLAFRVVDPAPHLLAAQAWRAKVRFLVIFLGCLSILLCFAVVLFRRARNAQKLAELRTDFVAAVSHELRTPLASVRMFAELLEAGDIPEDERTEVEQMLAGETRRLHATLDRMLSFGALSRGKLVVVRSRQLIRSILERVTEKRRVKIEADPALEANVDADLLRLAIDNLLSNAAKYAPPVTSEDVHIVRAVRDGDELVIDVIDRGPGLSRRARSKVFLPFERADQQLSRAVEGSGVGLALVRGIARAHGGDATVTSELGAGATFTLRLPCS